VPRGRLINLRVNDAEYDRLARLADHYGVNVSSVIRLLAKRDAVALGLEPTTATARLTDAELLAPLARKPTPSRPSASGKPSRKGGRS
jgi:antitoxin component of RelBE/YafQ-DinJ toxin-antitoxin module